MHSNSAGSLYNQVVPLRTSTTNTGNISLSKGWNMVIEKWLTVIFLLSEFNTAKNLPLVGIHFKTKKIIKITWVKASRSSRLFCFDFNFKMRFYIVDSP